MINCSFLVVISRMYSSAVGTRSPCHLVEFNFLSALCSINMPLTISINSTTGFPLASPIQELKDFQSENRSSPAATDRPNPMLKTPTPLPLPLPSISATASSSPPSPNKKTIWLNPNLKHRRPPAKTQSQSIDFPSLLSALSSTSTPSELHSLLPPSLPPRLLLSLLSLLPDHRRSLALLDFSLSSSLLPPSAAPSAYNIVLRNASRALDFPLAACLFHEMRRLSIPRDRFTYSTLLSSLSRSNLLDAALSFLPYMSSDSISPDLILFSTLISLALRLNDPSKALSLFSLLQSSRIPPDLISYNSLLSALSRAGLLRRARRLLLFDMDAAGFSPDAVSFSTLLSALAARRRFLEALSLFREMRRRRLPPDLTACNIALNAYGRLGMVREADRLFWSMRRRLGLPPSVVTCNTMLRVYGDAELFGEAVHLFRLMQRQNMEQNVVTYNTMISIYGKSLEHEKAGNLLMEMKRRGMEPNAVTYSTIISIWARAGRVDRAAKLFQKIRDSGVEIDPVLYQTMIVVYERAGLVAHARCLLRDLREPESGIGRETAVTILAGAGRVEEAAWVFRRAEVKSVEVFRCMMELFAKNRRHNNVVEVFDRMRAGGLFPDSEMISMVLNAYGKLQEFQKAEALYAEMEEEGCVFADKVHFQMLSLLGMKRDFKRVEELVEKLGADDADVDKKQLYLVAANVYERANRLDDAARIVGRMNDRITVSNALQV